jgi:hypothetical protein
MSADYSHRSTRQLPPDRLEQRRQHLLAEIAMDQGTRSRWSPLPGSLARHVLAVAAVVAVAAIAGFVFSRGGTSIASAAEVRAKLAEGLRLSQSIRGEVSVRTQDPGPRPRGFRGCVNCMPGVPLPSRFVIGADGSYSSITLPFDATQRNDIAYNAATRVETRFTAAGSSSTGGESRLYMRALNVDPAYATYGPEGRLGAWVQGALRGHDPEIKNTTYDGRSAWEMTVTFTPGQQLADGWGVRVDVVADRQTGVVLQVTQYAYDTERWTSIQSVRNLEIGAPTSADDYTVPKPVGSPELSWDMKFRRVPIAAARAIVGYSPLLPGNTLGRARSDFAVAKIANLAPPESGSPAIHDAVGARYGNGPNAITVSTRRGRLDELLTTTGIAGGTARPLKLTRGPFVGDYAYVSTDPLRAAVFACFHRGLIVQISAPSAQDAITVAESMRPVR